MQQDKEKLLGGLYFDHRGNVNFLVYSTCYLN